MTSGGELDVVLQPLPLSWVRSPPGAAATTGATATSNSTSHPSVVQPLGAAKLSPDRSTVALVDTNHQLYLYTLRDPVKAMRFNCGDENEKMLRCDWLVHPTSSDVPGCALACLSASDQLYILFFQSPIADTLPSDTASFDWEELVYRSYQNKLSKRTSSIADFVLPTVPGHYLCVQLQFILPTFLEQPWASPPQARLLGTSNDGIVLSVANRDVVVLQLWRANRGVGSLAEMTVILHQLNIEQICGRRRVLDVHAANGLFCVLFDDASVVFFNLMGHVVSTHNAATLPDRRVFAPQKLFVHPRTRSVVLWDTQGTIALMDLAEHLLHEPEASVLLAKMSQGKTGGTATTALYSWNGATTVSVAPTANQSSRGKHKDETSAIYTSSADGRRRLRPSNLSARVQNRASALATAVPADYGPLGFLQPVSMQTETKRVQLAKVLSHPRRPPYAMPYLKQNLLAPPAWSASPHPNKASSTSAPLSWISVIDLSKEYEGALPEALTMNEDNIVLQLSQERAIALWLRERPGSSSVATVSPIKVDETVLSVFYDMIPSAGFYVLRDGIVVRMRGLTQQLLLTIVVMFENPSASDLLCINNGWNRRLLAMRALHLGLTHRQLDVLVEALSNLQRDQHLEAVRLCLTAIQRSASGLAVSSEMFPAPVPDDSEDTLDSLVGGEIAGTDSHGSPLEIGSAPADMPPPTTSRVKNMTGAQIDYTFHLTQITMAFVSRHLRGAVSELLERFQQIVQEPLETTGVGATSTTPVQSDVVGNKWLSAVADQLDTSSDSTSNMTKALLSAIEPLLTSNSSSHRAINDLAHEIAALTSLMASLRAYLPSPATSAEYSTPAASSIRPERTGSISTTASSVAPGRRWGRSDTILSSMSYTSVPAPPYSSRTLEPYEATEFPVDAKTAALFARWASLNSVQIVEDALRRGVLSLALAYFKKENLLSLGSGNILDDNSSKTTTGSLGASSTSVVSLSAVRPLAYSLIYHAVRHQRIDQAIPMISNLGANVIDALREIMWFTVDPRLRTFLLDELRNRRELQDVERSVATFLSSLEAILSNTTFSSEIQRLGDTALRYKRLALTATPTTSPPSSTHTARPSTLATSLAGDVGDRDELLLSQGFTDHTTLAPSRTHTPDDLALSRYLQLPMAWLLDVDNVTRERLLLDAMGPGALTDDSGAAATLSVTAKWLYSATHSIVSNFDKMAAELPKVLMHMDSASIDLLQRSLRDVATPFIQQMYTHALVMSKMWSPLSSPSTTTTRAAALVLARAHQLFKTHPQHDSITKFSEDYVHQFHRDFITFALEQDLPRLLLAYIDQHNLLMTSEDVQQLLSDVIESEAKATTSAAANDEAERTEASESLQMAAPLGLSSTTPVEPISSPTLWLSMLLAFRLVAQASATNAPEEVVRQRLSEAAVASTAFSLDVPLSPTRTTTSQRGLLNAVVVRGRPLLAVGMLMLENEPVVAAAGMTGQSSGSAWTVASRRLNSALEAYPLLHTALALTDDSTTTPSDASLSSSLAGIGRLAQNKARPLYLFQRHRSPIGSATTPEIVAAKVARRLNLGQLALDISVYDLLQASVDGLDLRRLLSWQMNTSDLRNSPSINASTFSPILPPRSAVQGANKSGSLQTTTSTTTGIPNPTVQDLASPQRDRDVNVTDLDKSSNFTDFMDFGGFVKLVLPNSALEDQLDALYYLNRGRPLKALEVVKNHVISLGLADETSFTRQASWTSSPLLRKMVVEPVVRLAATTFNDTRIVTSCLMFLDLLNVPASALRVDLAVARRLLAYRLALRDSMTSVKRATSDTIITDELVMLLLRMCELSGSLTAAPATSAPTSVTSVFALTTMSPTTGGVAARAGTSGTVTPANAPSSISGSISGLSQSFLLMQVRKELETATISQLKPGTSATFTTPGLPASALAVQHWLAWSLVAAFCRVHALPPSRRLLEHSAAQNDAFTFLLTAEEHSYPPGIVLRVVDEHLGNSPMSEHLRGAVMEASINSANTVESAINVGISTSGRAAEAGAATIAEASSDTVAGQPALPPSIPANLLVSSPTLLSDDLFDVLFACMRGPTPSRSLLYRALQDQRPFLAILAAAVAIPGSIPSTLPLSSNYNNDVTVLECFCVWLYASCPRQLKFLDVLAPRERIAVRGDGDAASGAGTTMAANASPVKAATQTSGSGGGNANSTGSAGLSERMLVEWRRWTLADLTSMTMMLCQSRSQTALLEGWRIFDPSSPVVSFLVFQKFFLRADYAAAEEVLHKFVRELATLPEEEDANGPRERTASQESVSYSSTSTSASALPSGLQFGSAQWIHSLADRVLIELLNQCSSTFERRQLIEIVVRTGLDPRYRKMLRTLNIVEAAGLDCPITIEPAELVNLLLQRQRFELAREFAAEHGFPPHEVTIKEVNYHVAEFRKSSLWEMEFTRMALWSQCHHMFRQRHCDPSMAGDFFLQKADEIVFKDDHFAERAMVLLLALQWFKGVFSASEDDDSLDCIYVPVRTESFLDDLQKRLWLVTISAESSAASQKAGAEASEISKELGMSLAGDDFINMLTTWIPGLSISSETLTGLQGLVMESALETQREHRASVASTQQGTTTGNTRKDKGVIEPQLPSTAVFRSASFTPLGVLETIDHSDSRILQNELELQSLDMAIGRLLNAGLVKHAVALAVQFDHHSKDLLVVRTAIGLAEGTLAISQIPHDLTKATDTLKRDESRTSISAALEYLTTLAPISRDCVRRVVAHYDVAVAIDSSYTDLIQQPPFDVLQQLIHQNKDAVKLARTFVTVNRLDCLRVARLIAFNIEKALVNAAAASDTVTDKGPVQTTVPEGGPAPSGSPLTADPSWSPTEFIPYANIPGDTGLLGQALLELVVRPFANPFLIIPSTSALNLPSADTLSPPQLHLPGTAPTGSPVATLGASISPSASGVVPTSKASSGASTPHRRTPSTLSAMLVPPTPSLSVRTLPFVVEVELLVRAHYCFGLVSNFEGIERVLAIARERVDLYIQEGKFGLLIRLLSAFRKYREMEYVFDALIKYDMFELVLRKAMDKDSQMELKLALHDYLQRKRPNDTERLTMVYIYFNMFREIGDTLWELGGKLLRGVRDRSVTSAHEDLLRALQLFSDAAESFGKEDCVTQVIRCVAMGNLVALQLQVPQMRLVNLTETEVRRLMATMPRYSDARIIAEAYERDNQTEWVNAVYAQAIVGGNVAFAEHHCILCRPGVQFFQELVMKFRTDSTILRNSASSVTHLRRVIDYCNEILFVYRVAVELKFFDLVERIATELPGVDELAPALAL